MSVEVVGGRYPSVILLDDGTYVEGASMPIDNGRGGGVEIILKDGLIWIEK